MPRFFVEEKNIKENEIIITGQEFKHMKNVLRLDVDSEITIGDAKGTDYKAYISEVTQEYIIANIIQSEPSKSEPNIKITMFQSLVKGDRFEWAIQKAIEIGVSEIVPIKAARCVVKINKPKKIKSKLKRWNKIAKAAAKQSGRGIIPKVLEPVSYKQAVKHCSSMDTGIIAYEKENSNALKDILRNHKGNNVGIIIGPEGGFTKEEVAQATSNNIETTTLGPRILRSETAGLVLSSNILYELGEQV